MTRQEQQDQGQAEPGSSAKRNPNPRKNRSEAESDTSYGPGIFGAGDGPSSDMQSTPLLRTASETDSTAEGSDEIPENKIQENAFVEIPFAAPAGVHMGRILEVDTRMKKIKVDWLFTTNNKDYYYKSLGDVGYFPPAEIHMARVLCAVPTPSTVCTSRRYKMYFDDATLQDVQERYDRWLKLHS